MADQPLHQPYSDAELPGVIVLLRERAEESRLTTVARRDMAATGVAVERDNRIAERHETAQRLYARLAATLAELEQFRQDALRWRAVRPFLVVDEYRTQGEYYGWGLEWIGNTQVGDLPVTLDKAMDQLASRSLPGALKQEKGR